MARPIRQEEREWLHGMLAFERRAVIPLKWLFLAVSVYFLIVLEEAWYYLPEVQPFILFIVYLNFNIAQSYFFYFRPIHTPQIRPFVLASFLMDLLFVSGVLWLDGQLYFGRERHDDLYVFYFLVVLRGVATFRTPMGKILMNIALSAMFVLTAWQTFGDDLLDPLRYREFALKLCLIWMVMLVSWFIIDLVNRQADQLGRVRERLLRSEHLATVGQLAAGVAHEINNPIGIIAANCEYLLRTLPGDDPNREGIEAIHSEAGRVQGIVARLLDFSRPVDPDPSPCDVRELVSETAQFAFGAGKSRNVKLDIQSDDNLPKVHADANQLKQAFLNLLLNARQAIEDDGRIDIRLRKRSSDDLPLEITIADNGPGLSEEAFERAFEPFFTRRRGGTGLGLYVTQRIIESHDGEISLEPREGGGTMARVRLPAVSDTWKLRSAPAGVES